MCFGFGDFFLSPSRQRKCQWNHHQVQVSMQIPANRERGNLLPVELAATRQHETSTAPGGVGGLLKADQGCGVKGTKKVSAISRCVRRHWPLAHLCWVPSLLVVILYPSIKLGSPCACRQVRDLKRLTRALPTNRLRFLQFQLQVSCKHRHGFSGQTCPWPSSLPCSISAGTAPTSSWNIWTGLAPALPVYDLQSKSKSLPLAGLSWNCASKYSRRHNT